MWNTVDYKNITMTTHDPKFTAEELEQLKKRIWAPP